MDGKILKPAKRNTASTGNDCINPLLLVKYIVNESIEKIPINSIMYLGNIVILKSFILIKL